jgi:hypothetical protein
VSKFHAKLLIRTPASHWWTWEARTRLTSTGSPSARPR